MSVGIHLHFLAFKAGRYSAGKDYVVGIGNFRKNLIHGLFLVGEHVELHVCHAEYLNVVNLYVVFLSWLHIV